jgi:hypothetical protein
VRQIAEKNAISWSGLHYFPHPPRLLLVIALAIGVLGLVLRFVLVDYAYQRLGLSRTAAWLINRLSTSVSAEQYP